MELKRDMRSYAPRPVYTGSNSPNDPISLFGGVRVVLEAPREPQGGKGGGGGGAGGRAVTVLISTFWAPPPRPLHEEIPPHELSVNGLLQLIWSFAF